MQALMPYWLLVAITAPLQQAFCAPVNENSTSVGRAGLTPDGFTGLVVNIIGLFLTAFGVLTWMCEVRGNLEIERIIKGPGC